mgnify:CR=1 FL=1
MINIDITLLIQLVNFLVTLVIINYLIVRPIRCVLARRRAANDAMKESAKAYADEAMRKMEGYTARIAQARADVAALRENVKLAAGQRVQETIQKANEEARRIHLAESDRVRAESTEAKRVLESRVDTYVDAALKTILG